ncbi:transcript variant X2, partial [Nothobranchius furzeri]
RPTASTRLATGSSPSASTAKTSTAASKPTTPKPAPSKPAAPKSTTTTPSAGKAPPTQAARNKTPVKKDVTKPSTPATKKPSDPPLARPSSATKSVKVESSVSSSKPDVTTRKPTTPKAAETKAPSRPKTQESKSAPSKDASRTPATKTAAAKSSSPKKTIGSSTPTPVKRAPKPATAAEPGTEIAAAVAAAAAIATAASARAGPEELQPPEAVEPPAAAEAVQEKIPKPSPETVSGAVCEPVQELIQQPIPEPAGEPTPEPVRELTPEPIREPTPEPAREPTPEPVRELTPEPIREPTPEPVREPTPEPVREPTPEPVREPTPEPVREPTPEPVREPTPEPAGEPTPEPIREPTPEPVREPIPEPAREPTPESIKESTPEPAREPTPEPAWEPTPKPFREPTPEPVREPTPEPVREPTPEPVREPTPEPVREPTPEPVREPTPEPVREPTPEPVRVPTPEPVHVLSSNQKQDASSEPRVEVFFKSSAEPELKAEPASGLQTSAQVDPFPFEDHTSVPSLGTTVMSPPCSPPAPASPVRDSHVTSSLLDMDVQPDPWDRNQSPVCVAPQSLVNVGEFQLEERREHETGYGFQEEQEEEKENQFVSPSVALGAFPPAAQPHSLEDFTLRDLVSPQEKEEEVEKAEEEINEDEEDDEDDEEDVDEEEEQRRPGQQLSSLITDMSMSQPSDEFPARSSLFGGSAGWAGDDLLSGMDSEDVSSCTSSRQQGVSDLSSTQHTAILEGTQSSDALVDSSLRGSEGDGNLIGSPNVETLANEEEEDDEEDDRVDDIDMSSEQVEEHHKEFQEQRQEEEEDEDVEMHSEGVMDSCENVDDDFNEEDHLDDISVPPASSWGHTHTNPFSDTWAQPAALLSVLSPSPVSDRGAAESETPAQSPAQACVDSTAPSFPPQLEREPHHHSAHEMKDSGPGEDLLAVPATGVSPSALAARSSSETSTPEDLRDYDSSSGVESRSDKQHTPVPVQAQSDLDQDLGIHLEKGDGEEEEAETLPADEVLGTGPPTAPASAPSSTSTSGDEASDTEGEIQINDPEAPMMMMMMEERAGFESPPPSCNLPALEKEAGDTPTGDGEEDGGGATPQSANSVASYGFDCTTSNSNAHSMAESCGKSPGIFSLENEEQLPEEAKDPSLIKELTLPSAAAAQSENLLGSAVDLIPLGHPGVDDHHYLFGGKIAGEGLEDPQECSKHPGAQEREAPDSSQPPYYSTVCDKTDSFLEGNV